MKIKKTKKSVKQRGNTTHGHGARKKWKKSGHKGGVGMAGSGKRGDQKKTMITAKYGNKYFGKQGITSKKTEKKKRKVINLGRIEKEYDNLMKKFRKGDILDLGDYKLLGGGEIGRGVKLKVREVSDGVRDKIEKAGGSVEVLKKDKKSNLIKDGGSESGEESGADLEVDKDKEEIKEEKESE